MKSDWETTQERQLREHSQGVAVFSDKNKDGARQVGQLLNNLVPYKKCLDVGCGILPLPYYMKVADNVRFTGIDPFEAGDRQFEFIMGMAESLPFADESFDAVLFATSIDHIDNPMKAINEAYRVLKYDGYLVIWGSFRNEEDTKYKLWKETRAIEIYNHPWVFTINSIHELLSEYFNLIKRTSIVNAEKILVYQK